MLKTCLFFLILCSNIFADVPKLGTYQGPQEVRFTVFSVCGSTRSLSGGTTVEFYSVGETPYTKIFTLTTTTDVFVGYWGQDVVAPAKVTTLSASRVVSCSGGEIRLSWLSPGDDHFETKLTPGSSVYIAWTTSLSDAQNPVYWENLRNNNIANIIISTHGVSPRTSCVYLVTNLTNNVTYYFRIWYKDAERNISELSLGATEYPTATPVGHTDGSINTYTTLASGGDYGAGTNIVYAKTSACGRVFLVRGGATVEFYEYSIPENIWVRKADLPVAARTGCCMVWTGPGSNENYIYLLTSGVPTGKFMRYDIANNSWDDVNIADLPTGRNVGSGSALVWTGGDHIYALLGETAGGPFLRYSISSNSWDDASVTDFGVMLDAGGALAYD
ncbi:MAG: hypothetical protein NZ839_04710, partial [Endomicrobia bacterium]|nr:hypothetical protein [Endomicrobiia bacterium]